MLTGSIRFLETVFFICHPEQSSENISSWDRHYLLARELLPRFTKNPSQKLDLVMSVGALKGLSELFFCRPKSDCIGRNFGNTWYSLLSWIVGLRKCTITFAYPFQSFKKWTKASTHAVKYRSGTCHFSTLDCFSWILTDSWCWKHSTEKRNRPTTDLLYQENLSDQRNHSFVHVWECRSNVVSFSGSSEASKSTKNRMLQIGSPKNFSVNGGKSSRANR